MHSFQYFYDQSLTSYNKISRQWRYIKKIFLMVADISKIMYQRKKWALPVEESNVSILPMVEFRW